MSESGIQNFEQEEEDRLSVFIESRQPALSYCLKELEKKALEEHIPIIRTQTQCLLQFLMELKNPMRVLEVGSAVGFSALVMEERLRQGGSIVTIERDPERAEAARKNFGAFHIPEERICLLEGDAAQLLKTMEGPFDLIFMDAAKGQYIHFLPQILRLLAPGGLLISDNILKGGELLESKFAVTRRNRTIHKRMREYLDALMTEENLSTLLLETGDGTALSIKREKNR